MAMTEWIVGQEPLGYDVVKANTMFEALELWWDRHHSEVKWPHAVQISPRQAKY